MSSSPERPDGGRRHDPDLLRRWGVDAGYHDAFGTWHDADEDTLQAVVEQLGVDGDEPPAPPVWVVERGEAVAVDGAWRLHVEDGTELDGVGDLPPDLPLGYHRLVADDVDVRLVVHPGRCPAPADRVWGWAVQLYAARSRRSWGIGDLRDLATFGSWATSAGAGFVLLNPLHASHPVTPGDSPYSPASRVFLDPLYLPVDGEPPPSAVHDPIDRRAVWEAKRPALEAQFAAATPSSDFDDFVASGGTALHAHAVWSALSEVHDGPWPTWSPELRRPDTPAVAEFAASPAGAERVRFHQWLQWRLGVELGRAAETVPIVTDLAVGVDAGGGDAWRSQDAFALGMRVGAPPDEFNTAGQDWGLPPFDPWRLRAACYEPFVEIVRAAVRHAAGVRIDHVMGLFRLWWLPEGASPTTGVYVRYPWRDLLGILALEAHRAGAVAVGEDLGTVEEGVRERLADAGVMSYRLAWFEPERPERWPAGALGAVTTHDLPTVAGMWTGSDDAELESIGVDVNTDGVEEMRRRIAEWSDVGDRADPETVSLALHGLLAESPCQLVAATLDDALLVERRPNVPGTTSERPNWSLPLPVPVEDVPDTPSVARLVDVLSAERSGPLLPSPPG